jgi:xylulokinase
MYLMGIDLGTSGIKTIILDPDGNILASTYAEYATYTPHPGWVEQDPQDWFQSALDTVRCALSEAGVPADTILAIGLSGQMHGTICLDVEGMPLRPAIIWADQRSQEQVGWVKEKISMEQLGRWTANPLATGFMLSSWMWIKRNEPQIARRTAHLLLPKDYLRYLFTGELGSEPSDASSTSLFDTAKLCWSQELLDRLEIDLTILPPIHASAEVAGYLLKDVAEASGLRPGTAVVFGGSDQACQALGQGLIEPGTLSCTIGTGGQLLAPLHHPTHDPGLRLHTYCHAFPGRWFQMAATLSAGLSLKWLRDNVFRGDSYQGLADVAATVSPGCEGLFFLPHLVGERTPHMDPNARGAFVGLTLRHGGAHLARAVMEGVVFSLKIGLDLMIVLGVPVNEIVASGGATNHPLWLQLQADVFNCPIHQTATVEAAAVGAALLAGAGVGFFPDLESACKRNIKRRDEVIHPNEENARRYAESYPLFCQLYPSLKTAYTQSET